MPADSLPVCCISLYSYIKPQRFERFRYRIIAVYPYIPTSNRNGGKVALLRLMLYILIFLHQTATLTTPRKRCFRCISLYSYIKPQPYKSGSGYTVRCISLYSYIKPQLIGGVMTFDKAVYPYIPTSNRNIRA